MMAQAIKVADIDGDEEVSAEEFTAALESIHEAPKMCDIRELHQRMGHMKRDISRNHSQSMADLQMIKEQLGRIEVALQGGSSVLPTLAALPPIIIKETNGHTKDSVDTMTVLRPPSPANI